MVQEKQNAATILPYSVLWNANRHVTYCKTFFLVCKISKTLQKLHGLSSYGTYKITCMGCPKFVNNCTLQTTISARVSVNSLISTTNVLHMITVKPSVRPQQKLLMYHVTLAYQTI